MTWLLIGLGGAVGATARYLVDAAVTRRFGQLLPWGTLTVNLTGSAAFGLLVGLVSTGAASGRLLALLGTGVCGAFTTASTLAYETVALIEQGSARRAVANLTLTLALGLPFAAVGLAVGLAA
jgi:CrcB protein